MRSERFWSGQRRGWLRILRECAGEMASPTSEALRPGRETPGVPAGRSYEEALQSATPQKKAQWQALKAPGGAASGEP